MTEIRPAIDARHIPSASHVIGQLPPPPTKSQRSSSISQVQRQNSLKRDPETSPGHIQPVLLPQPISIVSSNTGGNADSVSSSPIDVAVSPSQSGPQSLDKTWSFLQKQDGHLSWAHFEERHHLLGNDEDSSERHSSDEDFDIWSITDEQREYYVNQFRSMQPDLYGKITGAAAKDFFEKSKLPVMELSKIWHLSDVDKDGALSLEEFCTAMHLVVLRRNNIELPDVLPPSLAPRIAKKVNDHVPSTLVVANQPVQHPVPVENNSKQSPSADVVSPQNKEWTKFNDSPTSSLSSPGMKPVNFDFSAASVEQDPKILHPVALRLSPDRQTDTYSGPSEKIVSVPSEDVRMNSVTQVQAVQRPAPRKLVAQSLSCASHSSDVDFDGIQNLASSFSGTGNARSGSLSQGAISLPQGPKKEPPPPPPPRPKHNHHIRSSSLDLNKLGSTVPHFLGVPPAVPPRISPSTSAPQKAGALDEDIPQDQENEADFADFSNFGDSENSKMQLPLKSGAFEIYKKPFFFLLVPMQTLVQVQKLF